jgi:hypothetical protein
MAYHILDIDRTRYRQVKRWSDRFTAAAGAAISNHCCKPHLGLCWSSEQKSNTEHRASNAGTG